MAGPGEVTRLLSEWQGGDQEAFNRLLPLLYDHLKRIARGHARRLRPGQTLDTTGLVHEAYMRLVEGGGGATVESRNHFLSVCARAMRQIAIDSARSRAAAKRGGGQAAVTLEEERLAAPGRPEWLLDLDAALGVLGARSPRQVQVVECRFFAGLSEEETAEVLGVSLRTVQLDWMKARAWLKEEMGGWAGDGGPSRE